MRLFFLLRRAGEQPARNLRSAQISRICTSAGPHVTCLIPWFLLALVSFVLAGEVLFKILSARRDYRVLSNVDTSPPRLGGLACVHKRIKSSIPIFLSTAVPPPPPPILHEPGLALRARESSSALRGSAPPKIRNVITDP